MPASHTVPSRLAHRQRDVSTVRVSRSVSPTVLCRCLAI